MITRHVMPGLLVLALLALCACTTMKEVDQPRAELARYLKIGDHIVVYEKSGRIYDMRFVLVEGDELRGSMIDDGLDAVVIKLDDIAKIEAERIAAGRTTVAVLGGIVLAPLAAVGAGLALSEQ